MEDCIRKLGRYELLKRIAEGGMGEIYLARQKGAGGFEKNLIIKTILPHLATEEEFVEKFLDEGRIVVQLVHGNIVPVFDMGQEAGEYYIAMEYIAGRDLREIQKRLTLEHQTMPVELALFIVHEFCKGLDYAHRKVDNKGVSMEIVHRDVSPSNVLISGEGEVKLIDFGIARATSRMGKTVTGRIQGKFCYMSPEQAGGKAMDGRSDLFSAGVVLYELLTGMRPFEGKSDLETLDMVRRCEFDPPSTLNHEVDEELDTLVLKTLSKNAEDRFASVDEFQHALMQLLYAHDRRPSSKNLGAFLLELFPEGLEHSALRKARDSDPNMLGAMSLDDALEMQLDGIKPSVDPFHTTAIAPQGSEGTTKKEGLDAKESSVSGLLDSEITPGPTSLRHTQTQPYVKQGGRKRALVVGLFLGAILAVSGLIYLASGQSYALTLIESTPSGAEIAIDGATLPGSKTPFETSLEIGKREITLSLEGYHERKFILDISEEKKNLLSSDVAELKLLVNEGPRTLSVTTIPSDAKLFVGTAEIGLGSGTILIQKNNLVKVRAEKEGCGSRLEMVGYDDPRSDILIHLECEKEPPLENKNENRLEEKKDERLKDISFRSVPSGADILNHGKKIGRTPFRKKFKKNEKLSLLISKQGYQNETLKRKVSRVKTPLRFVLDADEFGCLNFSIGFPMVAQLAIDGIWIKGALGRLRNHKLSVGKHRIRVKNETANKDESFNFTINRGEKCTSKHVWKRQP